MEAKLQCGVVKKIFPGSCGVGANKRKGWYGARPMLARTA